MQQLMFPKVVYSRTLVKWVNQ